MSVSSLQLYSYAQPRVAIRMRHALSAFLNVLEVKEEKLEDVLTAVGEALANVVEHAYTAKEAGQVFLSASYDAASQLTVTIMDNGSYIVRQERDGRGFGLKIIKAIARNVAISTDTGTRIEMTFEV